MTARAPRHWTGVLVIGGGPAGLAPLIAASARGLLPDLLLHGLTVVERSDRLGDGRLGGYVINSDSSAQTFLSCLDGDHDPRIAALADHPVAQAIAALGRDTVPLALAGELLRLVGGALATVVAEAPAGRVMTGWEAMDTRRRLDGGWSTRLRCRSTGRTATVASRTVLIATGGEQTDGWLERTPVAGQPLLPHDRNRLLRSDHLLTAPGIAEATARLAAVPAPRVVLVGGASSALSCARVLLHPDRLSSGAEVTLMHRSRLTLFYPSAAAALADGYDAFGPEDVCPVSGFVFRFGGLRFDNRTLAMGALGIGGAPDPRLRLHRMRCPEGIATHEQGEEWGRDRLVLDRADLIVSCMGYRPRALPVLDVDGRALPLAADRPGGALVGPECDVLDGAGEPLGGMFGIGLAAGFRPGAALGGESSFNGQINGLWLWQNDIGLLIAERMLAMLRMPQGFSPMLEAGVAWRRGDGGRRPERILSCP